MTLLHEMIVPLACVVMLLSFWVAADSRALHRYAQHYRTEPSQLAEQARMAGLQTISLATRSPDRAGDGMPTVNAGTSQRR